MKNTEKINSDDAVKREDKREMVFLSTNTKLEQQSFPGEDVPKEKFYLNDKDISLENDIDSHSGTQPQNPRDIFEVKVKNEVSNFINQAFDNIVFLVGAGASIIPDKDKKGKSGMTVSNISKIVEQELKNGLYKKKTKQFEVFTLEEMIKKTGYSFGVSSKKFNFEDLMSLIISFEKFESKDNRVKYGRTKNAIFDIIKKCTAYDFDSKVFNHIGVIKALSNIVKPEHKLNIVTTNYDTLIEDAANEMNYTVFDGFSFSQQPIFNSEIFDWNLVKQVPHFDTKQLIYDTKSMNLFKIHGSLTWENDKELGIVRKHKNSVKDPIMIFPSSEKYAQSYQEPYFELFAKFQDLLKQPNTLFITTGFSFADNHISRMIMSAIKVNTSLSTLVTDYKISSKNENWNELVSIMQSNYRVAFLKATMNETLGSYLGAQSGDDK